MAQSRNSTELSSLTTSSNSIDTPNNYGLPSNYKHLFPKVGQELDNFLTFMTQPSASSLQESPIRKATAAVYIRHCKLFLGWYNSYYSERVQTKDEDLSIYTVFPNKAASSAHPIVDFILWLRSNRAISDSYEANMLRGLTKLLKFRYHTESCADPSSVLIHLTVKKASVTYQQSEKYVNYIKMRIGDRY